MRGTVSERRPIRRDPRWKNVKRRPILNEIAFEIFNIDYDSDDKLFVQ